MNKYIVKLNGVLFIDISESVTATKDNAERYDSEELAGEALSRIRKRLKNDFETAEIEETTI